MSRSIRWTGPIDGASASVWVDAGVATATGSAYNGAPSLASFTFVFPDPATAVGEALDPQGNVAPTAGVAAATGAALDPDKVVTGRVVYPTVGTATGVAYDLTVIRLDNLAAILTYDETQNAVGVSPVQAALHTLITGNVHISHRAPWRCQRRACKVGVR